MNDSASNPAPPSAAPSGSPSPAPISFGVGTDGHKRAFCGVVIDSFDPTKPTAQPWPTLPDAALNRLVNLPFWDVAIERDGYATCRMQALADSTADPLIKKAIALNAFEKGRHKLVLRDMLKFYGIKLRPENAYGTRGNREWLLLCTGYGECFDSFFAFGLFKMAKDSGFFPPELVDMFEPIMQEEARHILFFVNWVIYTEINKSLSGGIMFRLKTLAAFGKVVLGRLTLTGVVGWGKGGNNFVITGGATLTADMTLRKLIEVALAENDRRLASFNPVLPRPQIVPFCAKIVLFFIRLMKR